MNIPAQIAAVHGKALRPLSHPRITSPVFLILLFLCLSYSTRAAVVTVTTTADTGTGSLRWAVSQAFTGDTIRFASDVRGMITLRGGSIRSLTPKDLTIEGPGADRLAISGNKTGRILNLPGQLVISDLTFTRGATGFALVLNAGQSGHGTIKNCTFTRNNGTAALSLVDGTWDIDDCAFTANSSAGTLMDAGFTGSIQKIGAPALFVSYLADAHLNRTVFSTNQAATAFGGAIVCAGALTATDCTLSNNAARNGGAVYAVAGAIGTDARFLRCTFNSNSCTGRGGAIVQNAAIVRLDTCTIYGNKATIGGGLSALSWKDQTYIDSSTFTMNRALRTTALSTGRGGGIASNSVFMIIGNSIIAGNWAPRAGRDILSFVVSQDGNLIGTSAGATANPWKYADMLGSDASPTDPKLAPLGNNGGFTATAALLSGSPAIDKGVMESSGSTVDQTGAPRINDRADTQNAPNGDGRDIGAYELQNISF